MSGKRYRDEDQAGKNSPRPPKKAQFDHDSYTVAWICALPLEMAAACAMLDDVHEALPQDVNDSNCYALGTIGQHNVTIACLPNGEYGTNNAAIVFTNMRRTFKNIQLGLMVGIGGGAPSKVDLRLGDIIVGSKVIQHDMGKARSNGLFTRSSIPRPVSSFISTAISSLRSKHYSSPSRVPSILLERFQELEDFERPTSEDRLFEATYTHVPSTPDCASCDQSKLVQRLPRDSHDPVIHYGAIASGNYVIKDSLIRDKLAQELDVICFEMEAAGLMDICPCLPVRGICDYSDSHKAKEWQKYAAATAVAYAREFLEELTASEVNSEPKQQFQIYVDEKDEEYLRDLYITNPEDDKEAIITAKGGLLVESYRWVMESEGYQQWAEGNQNGLLWVKGDPGRGKTMLLCGIINELETYTAPDSVFYFFCQASEPRLRSASAVLRGLIWFLARRRPSLIPHIRKEYDDSGKDVFNDQNAWEALSNIMASMLDDKTTSDCIFVVDALDECSDDRERLIEFLTRLFSSSESKWIVSTRNLPEIGAQLDGVATYQVHLDLNHTSFTDPIQIFIARKVEDLATKKRYTASTRDAVMEHLLSNANDSFLWVSLVCKELGEYSVLPHHTLKLLQSYPARLDELYQLMINQILQSRDGEVCKAILAVVATAFKPLTLAELAASDGILMPFQSDLETLSSIVSCCGSFLTVRENIVYIVHQSAKDYLLNSPDIFPDSVESDLDSLWSEGGSMSSTAPSSLLQSRRDGVGLLATLLFYNDDLGPLYSEARTKVSSKKLTRHLHGFLREYGTDLIHEAKSGVQNRAAEFVANHAVYMAKEIISLLDAKHSDNYSLKLPVGPPEKTKNMINKWLVSASNAERTTEAPRNPVIVAVDEEENPVIDDSKATYDALQLAKEFLLSAEAFRALQRALRNWVKQDEGKDTVNQQGLGSRQNERKEIMDLSKSEMKQPSYTLDDIESRERRPSQLSDIQGVAVATESGHRGSSTTTNIDEAEHEELVDSLDANISEVDETSPLVEIERQEIVNPTWARFTANLWYRLMAILDPPPDGAHRVTYTCECGNFQYLDVEELVPGGAAEFQQAISDAASAVRQQAPTPHPVTSNTSTLHQGQSSSSFSTEPGTGIQSNQYGSISSCAVGTRVLAGNSQQSVVCPDPKYLLICINTKYGYARLGHVDVSSINGDEDLFEGIRKVYYSARQEHEWGIARFMLEKVCSRSLFQLFGEGRLLVPVKMEFAQFRLHPVGTKICTGYMVKPRIPDQEEMRKEAYEYLPVPQDVTVLKIPAHALLKPGRHLDNFWRKTFPKKLNRRLEYVQEEDPPVGWGIHVSEDWNKPLTALLILLLVVFFGGFVIIYGILSKDWGTGATVGSFLIALYILYCTLHYQWWIRK